MSRDIYHPYTLPTPAKVRGEQAKTCYKHKCTCGQTACYIASKQNMQHLQYRSNVSYHLSSRFSRDESRFLRDSSRFLRGESRFSWEGSRFSRESLKCSVWNILLVRSRYQSDGTHRRDNKKDSSLQLLARLKIISIYLVLFGRIGWFKHWNSPNLQKKVLYRSSYDAL